MDVEDGVKGLEVREEEHRVEGARGEGVPAMCFLEQVLPIQHFYHYNFNFYVIFV